MDKKLNLSRAGKIEETDIRCCCGKLQARSANGAIIIKCGRCKRKMIIRLEDLSIQTSG